MEISNSEALASVQSAVQIAALRNAINLNSGTVNMLVEGVQDVSRTIIENSITPSKGGNIDVIV